MSIWSAIRPANGWTLHIAATDRGVVRLAMAAAREEFLAELNECFPEWDWQRDDRHPLVDEAASQLAEYFSGRRRSFNLPLDLRGTRFQLRVWRALEEIPYGETRSYVDVARAIGEPKAARAVGGANGCNPVGIVVPCHRVIAAGGGLGGFGCGLEFKRALLRLEGWSMAGEPSLLLRRRASSEELTLT